MTRETTLEIEIYVGGTWRRAGEVTLLGKESEGENAASEFCYDLDYAQEFADAGGRKAVSCALPVSLLPATFDSWPPFLLDLFPQGAALRYVVDHYRIADLPKNYWKIIKTAVMNPPGNLRAVVSADDSADRGENRAGFTRGEVIEKGPGFLEYMVTNGAPVAGTTGAGGAAPKFLLREDHSGRFHADGTLENNQTSKFWLVKYPRGKSGRDREILKAERGYLEIAKALGFDVYASLEWEEDCLFIPRFDRRFAEGDAEYFGLESLYSLVGDPGFGSRLRHETYIAALKRHSSDPDLDIVEYVLRDFLNIAFGNTDNHGRNSSMLKMDHEVRLSPLYDFAPMQFDDEGIVRNTRWDDRREFDLDKIVAFLEEAGINLDHFHERLKDFVSKLGAIEASLADYGIPEEFIEGTASARRKLIQQAKAYLANVA